MTVEEPVKTLVSRAGELGVEVLVENVGGDPRRLIVRDEEGRVLRAYAVSDPEEEAIPEDVDVVLALRSRHKVMDGKPVRALEWARPEARLPTRLWVVPRSVSAHRPAPGQPPVFRAEVSVPSQPVAEVTDRETFSLLLADEGLAKAFAEEPWCLIPLGPDETLVAVPKWLRLPLGPVWRETPSYFVYRITRVAALLWPLPEKLREALDPARRPHRPSRPRAEVR